MHNYFNLHKCDWLQIDTEHPQNGPGKLGLFIYFILFYFILFYFILFYFILFYFILFYFVLFYFIFAFSVIPPPPTSIQCPRFYKWLQILN